MSKKDEECERILRLHAEGKVVDLRKKLEIVQEVADQFAADAVALRKELEELRTPLKDWDAKLAEKNRALEKRNARIAEMEKEYISAVDQGTRYWQERDSIQDAAREQIAKMDAQECAYLDTIHRLEERLAALEVKP